MINKKKGGHEFEREKERVVGRLGRRKRTVENNIILKVKKNTFLVVE